MSASVAIKTMPEQKRAAGKHALARTSTIILQSSLVALYTDHCEAVLIHIELLWASDIQNSWSGDPPCHQFPRTDRANDRSQSVLGGREASNRVPPNHRAYRSFERLQSSADVCIQFFAVGSLLTFSIAAQAANMDTAHWHTRLKDSGTLVWKLRDPTSDEMRRARYYELGKVRLRVHRTSDY